MYFFTKKKNNRNIETDNGLTYKQAIKLARKAGACEEGIEAALKYSSFEEVFNSDHPKAAEYAYYYAWDVIKKPYETTPRVILEDAHYAYYYAKYVLKKPYDETPKAILSHGPYALYYARDVLKRPYIKTPAAILDNAHYAYIYARDILKKSYDETPESLLNDEYYYWLYHELTLRRFISIITKKTFL